MKEIRKVPKKALSFALAMLMVMSCMVVGFTPIASAASVKASTVSSKDLKFIVPEVIYLYPNASSWKEATATPFQYYINNNSNGSAKTAKDTTGYIYLDVPGSGISLSATFYNDALSSTLSGGSVSLSKTSGIGSTETVNITAGTSPSLAAATNGCYIEWCLSFTDSADNVAKKAYAYTYVYKPYVVPLAATSDAKSYGSTWSGSTTWISGIHSITPVSSYTKDTDYIDNYGIASSNYNNFSAFISESNVSYVGNTKLETGKRAIDLKSDVSPNTTTAGYSNSYIVFYGSNQSYSFAASDNSSNPYSGGSSNFGDSSHMYAKYQFTAAGTNKRAAVVHNTSYANIFIDTSRYQNLGDIPNLMVGLAVTDDEDCNNGTGNWYVADATGKEISSTNIDYYNTENGVKDRYNQKNYVIAGQTSSFDTHSYNTNEGPRYAGHWPKELLKEDNSDEFKASAIYIVHGFYSNNSKWGYYSSANQALDLHATQTNKSSLRTAVQNAIKAMAKLGVNGATNGSLTSCYFEADNNYKWTAFQTAYKNAVIGLTKLDSTADPSALATNLNNALNELCTKVTFNANGGSGTTSKYVTIGTDQKVNIKPSSLGVTVTRDGYTFKGWSTSSNGSIVTSVDVGYNNTLYAIWEKTATITFYSGINKATSSTVTATFLNDATSATITTPTTYTNVWTFKGWTTSTAANSSASTVGAGASVTVSGEATYYALYTQSHTLSYNKNGGTGTAPETSTATGYYNSYGSQTNGQHTVAANTFSKTGYTFAGWNTKADGSGTAYTAGSTFTNSSSADTLYAQWTANTYNVTLDAKGGSNGTASVTATYGSAMPSATMPTRTGYTFGGYYDAENGTGTQYYTAAGAGAKNWDKTSAATLYAKWTAVSSNVTLDSKGGTGGTESVNATFDSAMPTATMPTKTGYTFGGYYDGENGTGTQYYTVAGASAKNWDKTSAATLYAKWTNIEYTITLNANGGTCNTTSMTYTVGSDNSSLPIPTAPSNTEVFIGWYVTNVTDANGHWSVEDFVTTEYPINGTRFLETHGNTAYYGNITVEARYQPKKAEALYDCENRFTDVISVTGSDGASTSNPTYSETTYTISVDPGAEYVFFYYQKNDQDGEVYASPIITFLDSAGKPINCIAEGFSGPFYDIEKAKMDYPNNNYDDLSEARKAKVNTILQFTAEGEIFYQLNPTEWLLNQNGSSSIWCGLSNTDLMATTNTYGNAKFRFIAPSNCTQVKISFASLNPGLTANFKDMFFAKASNTNSLITYNVTGTAGEQNLNWVPTASDYPEKFNAGWSFGGWKFAGTDTMLTDETALTSYPNFMQLVSVWIPLTDDTYVVDCGITSILNVTSNDVTGGSIKSISNKGGKYTISLDNGKIKFSTDGTELSGPYEFEYVYTHDSKDYTGKVTIIPATSVYYEEDSNYISFGGTWTTLTDPEPDTSADYYAKRAGEAINSSYGALDAYTNDNSSIYSMGHAKYVEVSKDANNKDGKVYASFTFTGTGFEVYSITNSDSGYLTYTIKNNSNNTSKTYALNTYHGYEYGRLYLDGDQITLGPDGTQLFENEKGNISFGNKKLSTTGTVEAFGWIPTVSDTTDNSLYQIPVIRKTGLDYGSYTVTITPKYSSVQDMHYKDKSTAYKFYIDGVKILDPINPSTIEEGSEIYDAYFADRELNATTQMIREILIEDGSVSATSTGVAFLEKGKNNGDLDFVTYRDIGPKTEVYLEPGQIIAFNLTTADSVAPAKVSVGVKLLEKGSGEVTINENKISLNCTTESFKNIAVNWVASNDKFVTEGPIIIKNSGNSNIALTDIKWSYGKNDVSAKSRAMLFSVGPDILGQAAELEERIKATESTVTYDGVSVEWDSDKIELGEKANLIITAPKEIIKATLDGEELAGYEILENGSKRWTYTLDSNSLGNYEYTVVLYDKNGCNSKPISSGVCKIVEPTVDIDDAVIGWDKEEINIGESATLTVETNEKITAVTIGEERITEFTLENGRKTFKFVFNAEAIGDYKYTVVLEEAHGYQSKSKVTKALKVKGYYVNTDDIDIRWISDTVETGAKAQLVIKTPADVEKVIVDGNELIDRKILESGEKEWTFEIVVEKTGEFEYSIRFEDKNGMISSSVSTGVLKVEIPEETPGENTGEGENQGEEKLTFWQKLVRFIKKLFAPLVTFVKGLVK